MPLINDFSIWRTFLHDLETLLNRSQTVFIYFFKPIYFLICISKLLEKQCLFAYIISTKNSLAALKHKRWWVKKTLFFFLNVIGLKRGSWIKFFVFYLTSTSKTLPWEPNAPSWRRSFSYTNHSPPTSSFYESLLQI